MQMFELDWVLRLAAAMFTGVLIGFERHNRAKEAGIRTHAMVALGSCLLMIISKYGFRDIGTGDPARLAAQVVSGIGFLGAGVIFVRHDVVQGLTTAAGIWATSAIGLCYGAGMYMIGLIATILMVIVQHVFLLYLPHNNMNLVLRLKIHMAHEDGIQEVHTILRRNNFIQGGENRFSSDGQGGWYLICEASTHKNGTPEELIADLNNSEKLLSVDVL